MHYHLERLGIYTKKAYLRTLMITKEFFFKWRHFSFLFAVYSTAWWVGWYIRPLNKLCMWGHQKKTVYMNKYFLGKYQEVIQKYKSISYSYDKDKELIDFPIWFFWAQGIDNAPELVRSCYERVKKCNEGSVRLVNMENVSDFVEIPDYIYRKVNEGAISLTHFSDILRVCLLAQYGGLWVDSTCWVSRSVPPEIKSMLFYSSKSINVPKLPLWSDSRWCGWGMGAGKSNSVVFLFLKDMLFTYHKNEKYLLDYLLIDYLMFLGYNEIPYIRRIVDSVQENNTKRNHLHFLLNKPYNKTKYVELKPSWLFKLSYKTPWLEYTIDGQETFYHYLITSKLGDEFPS